MAEAPPPQKCRGIIVVDAAALDNLSMPCKKQGITSYSPLDMLRHPTKTYLDLLSLLAERGYRVIIPEMVIRESADMLADGTDLNPYFNGGRYMYATQPYVRAFMANAIDGHYPGVEVMAAQKQSDTGYAKYLAELKGIVKRKYGKDVKIPTRIIKNTRLVYFDKSHKDSKKDFGEAHCFDVIEAEIKRQRQSGESIPIFFLSPDDKARKVLRQRIRIQPEGHPPVNVLMDSGIFMALENDRADSERTINAFNEFGLTGSGEQHWQHIILNSNPFDKPPAYNKCTNGYYDAPLAAYGTGQFPFAESMRGLAAELAQEREGQKDAEAAASEAGERRAAALRAKFARVGVSTGNGKCRK